MSNPPMVIDDYNQIWNIDYIANTANQSVFTPDDLKGIEIPRIANIWLYLANSGYRPTEFGIDHLRFIKRMDD